LEDADFDAYPGEVVAVCGENGAGKSTLMKILAGAERADRGEIRLRGEQVRFGDVRAAADAGIAIVFQELSLFPDIDVLSNIAADATPTRWGVLDRREMRRRAEPVLDELGLNAIDLDRPVGYLSLSERQLLEIAKALLGDSSVLILDEPNSALSQAETERLFAVIERLKQRDVAIIYVSHRLGEVFRISDRIVVMRNGAMVDRTTPAATSIPAVVRTMIGRDLEASNGRRHAANGAGDAVVTMAGVTSERTLHDVDLEIRRGEVVGVAGLAGSGAVGVFDILFGLESVKQGEAMVTGRVRQFRSPRDAVQAGVARVPSDRRKFGLMLEKPLLDNVSMVSAGALGRHGRFLNMAGLRHFVADLCDALEVKARDIDVLAGQLSGGNQQKVVVAKWLAAEPDLILLDDPTRGIDVGAKAEIYHLMRERANEGHALLFRSSEMLEYEMVCDRVYIVRDGAIVGQLTGADITEHALLEGINAA
jgi:ABC-type sugar transport system ATPase subunit